MKISVLVYRQDLRAYDHPALDHALKHQTPVLALYADDPALDEPTRYGFPRRSSKRRAFLRQTLSILKTTLKPLGVPLIVLNQPLLSALKTVAEAYEIERVILHHTDGEEERLDDLALMQWYPKRVFFFEDKSLLSPHQLPFEIAQLPKTFTAFRQKVEALTPPPVLPQRQPQTAWTPVIPCTLSVETKTLVFPAGEIAAKERLEHYLFHTHAVKTYKETRNGMLLDDASSKFSPYLANGSLSVRWVYARLTHYERTVVKNDSTYWLFFELLWRDYFSFLSQQQGAKLFQSQALSLKPIQWRASATDWQRIVDAQTGFPLIDANLRMLYQTGYMSNRGRQNVASFITKNLRLDWRLGAAWFEHHLLDYDVASNYGNWAYVAGVGSDAREFRYFDVMKQGQLYDPDAQLLERYVPELNALPKHLRYRLPLLDRAVYEDYALQYPRPMVDFHRSLTLNKPYFIK